MAAAWFRMTVPGESRHYGRGCRPYRSCW